MNLFKPNVRQYVPFFLLKFNIKIKLVGNHYHYYYSIHVFPNENDRKRWEDNI